MAEFKCLKCGKDVGEGTSLCEECLAEEVAKSAKKEEVVIEQPVNQVVQQPPIAPVTEKKKVSKVLIGVIIAIVAALGIFGYTSYQNELERQEEEEREERYNSRPPKVDITMSEWYGSVSYILDEFDIDFDLATGGANCYTGLQSNTITHEKYGVLHIEFRYCKPNKTQMLRIYNSETDQKLRDPKDGEVPEFDKYGKKTSGGSSTGGSSYGGLWT